MKGLLRYVLPALAALGIACGEKKQDFPNGFYITPDSSDIVREERGDLEIFYAKDRLLVKPRSGTERGEIDQLASELSGEVTGYVENLNWYELRVPDARDALEEVKGHRAVRRAELNYAGRADGGGRLDIERGSIKGFAEGFYRIQVPEAYELLEGEDLSEPRVAVLDVGFDLEHPELESRYWRGVGFGDGGTNPTYSDLPGWFETAGHGTAVAGIIAAENNGRGLNGMAHQVKILPVKTVSSSTLGLAAKVADIWFRDNHSFSFKVAAGIAYAAQQGAKTINLSQGWYAEEPSAILEDAVEYAKEQGALIFASAGNDNTDARYHYPSALEDVISVGATTLDDRRADFSNYSLDDDRDVLVVAAPGHRITVVLAGEHGELALDRGSGTSYAAPFVAGLDALLLSADSSLGRRERLRIIRESADRIAVEYPGDDIPPETGRREWRRINAYEAMRRVVGGKVRDDGREGESEAESEAESEVEHDVWVSTSTEGAPEGRRRHTAVWTGSEMIVWGGFNGATNQVITGGRYDPVTDIWENLTMNGAPSRREGHSAVWTGSEMLVYGGLTNGSYSTTGGRFDPSSNQWNRISTSRAPPAYFHSSIWTGSEMIVWGSYQRVTEGRNTGGRYNPIMDYWSPTATEGAPSARFNHTAVWTGIDMIIWGGLTNGDAINTGGRYNPILNRWDVVSTAGSSRRSQHTAVWSGSEMIVWGGFDEDWLHSGSRYNSTTDSWAPVTTREAPSISYTHTAIWDGSEMILWGGLAGTGETPINNGWIYNPTLNNWSIISMVNSPSGRFNHTAIWTGSEMIIWGGSDGEDALNTGGRYRP